MAFSDSGNISVKARQVVSNAPHSPHLLVCKLQVGSRGEIIGSYREGRC